MPPISEYHRPATLDAALELVRRTSPRTRPLAGGTHFRGRLPQAEAVVDLCELGLKGVERQDSSWKIGAMTTLEELSATSGLPAALRRAALVQAPHNLRQRASLGGLVAAADSGPLLAGLLALNCTVRLEPGEQVMPLDVYLANDALSAGTLILGFSFHAGRRLGLAMLSRTPADVPILSVTLGGEPGAGQVWAAAGAAEQPWWLERQANPIDLAAAFSTGQALGWRDDARASGKYRRAMLPVLLRRALAEYEMEVDRGN